MLNPEQNGCHSADNIFKCILLAENVRISIKISLKIGAAGLIDKKWSLVQVMAWCHIGTNPLPEPLMTKFIEVIWHH